MESVVYITGHTNPDTDSVCAAIAYSEFKKRQGVEAVAIRLGDINEETEFVLKHFEVESPKLMSDVKAQVSDLDYDVIAPVSPGISAKTAWTLMKRNHVKVLPVADDSGMLLGIVSLSDITENYLDAMENGMQAISKTPLDNFIDTLDAHVLCGNEEKELCITGKVVIAAMSAEGMSPYIDKGDIVIAGNRKDNQLKAIELGAACMVLTCGESPDEEVLEAAKSSECIILSTMHDTFSVARLINQSIPVGLIMTTNDLVTFNVNDYISDVQVNMMQSRYRSYPVVDNKNRVLGFISRYHLISQRRKKVILLDHNELSQTVEGIEQAEIIEVIDHHRIGDIQTINPVHFRNEAVGSTSTIIASLYFENGIKPAPKIAGILYSAIISDTMNFKSPTSTQVDIDTANKLARIAGINTKEFPLMMFKAASLISNKSPRELLFGDFKVYGFGDYKIGVAQKNTTDKESIERIREELLEYMETICSDKNYNLLILMFTDMVTEGSELFFAGSDRWIISKAFNSSQDKRCLYADGIISRKKQVVPLIAAAIQNNQSGMR